MEMRNGDSKTGVLGDEVRTTRQDISYRIFKKYPVYLIQQ